MSGTARVYAPGQMTRILCRYNQSFTENDYARAHQEFGSRKTLAMDDLQSIPLLRELGAAYAMTHVKPEHLPTAQLFDHRLSRFRDST